MLPDRVSNPGPLTYESSALPIALRGPARYFVIVSCYFNLLSRNFKMLLCNFILQSRKNVTKFFSYLILLRFRRFLKMFTGARKK